MATKYTRESEVEEELDARRTPWIRQEHVRNTMSTRHRLSLVMVGVAAAILLIQLLFRLDQPFAPSDPVVDRGVATVVDKFRAENGADAGVGQLTLELVLADGSRHVENLVIPDQYWPAIAPGARVAILYQVNADGSGADILECGYVALSDELR